MSTLYTTTTKEYLPGKKMPGGKYTLIRIVIAPEVELMVNLNIGETMYADKTCILIEMLSSRDNYILGSNNSALFIEEGRLKDNHFNLYRRQPNQKQIRLYGRRIQNTAFQGLVLTDNDTNKTLLQITDREILALKKVCLAANIGKKTFPNWEQFFDTEEL